MVKVGFALQDSASSLKEMKSASSLAASANPPLHVSQSDSKLDVRGSNSAHSDTPPHELISGDDTAGLNRQDSGLPASLPADGDEATDDSQVRQECLLDTFTGRGDHS